MAHEKLSRATDCSIFKPLSLRNGVQLVLTHQPPGGNIYLPVPLSWCSVLLAQTSGLPTTASSLQPMLPDLSLTQHPTMIYSVMPVSEVLCLARCSS